LSLATPLPALSGRLHASYGHTLDVVQIARSVPGAWLAAKCSVEFGQ
jgi:hypothetical protein